jgi:signal transduction histidine kinase
VVDGKRIVQSMLGYTRDGVGPAEMFAVAPLLEETVRLLTRQFLSGVQLHLNVETALPEVIGYPARLKQMLLNFVVNASEAMSGKGDLWIEARSVGEVAGELILEPSEASRFIAISVRDSGPGLDRQTRSRIFEPFFTTKNSATTRGTGLGLSVVYTMAEQDGLGLDCQSAPGQGATFTIFFPVQARDGSGSPTSADVGATHNSSDER